MTASHGVTIALVSIHQRQRTTWQSCIHAVVETMRMDFIAVLPSSENTNINAGRNIWEHANVWATDAQAKAEAAAATVTATDTTGQELRRQLPS